MSTPSTPILIARTTPRAHANGAAGAWWAEYRVRALTTQEREALPWHVTELKHGVPSHVLEHRYCHEADSEHCTHHSGEWRTWDYGKDALSAAMSCAGDSHYSEAESLHPLHVAMVEHVKADRTRWERVKELRALTGHTERDWQTGAHTWHEINVEKDEQEQAQAEFESALKRARLWSKVQANAAPQSKVEAIKADVLARYRERLAARKETHAALMTELRDLEGGEA